MRDLPYKTIIIFQQFPLKVIGVNLSGQMIIFAYFVDPKTA
jgi:hypothetical protein